MNSSQNSKQETVSSSVEMEFKEYPQRFIVLASFLLIQTSYSLSIMTFNPISAQVSDIYNKAPVIVNMNGLIINFLALPLSIPVGYMIEKLGLRIGALIAVVLVITAAWLRALINTHYYFVLFGHILIGIGYPILQNTITKFSMVWFKAEKREKITRLIIVCTFLAVTIGNMISGMWFSNYNEDQDQLNNYEHGKNLTQSLMQVEAYIITGLSFLGILFFSEKPLTPPSFSAENKRENVKDSIKLLKNNKDYLLILLCFSIFNGQFHQMGVTLSFILKPFGFGSSSVTLIGIFLITFGVMGNIISGYLFRKKPQYKLFLIIGVLGMMIGFGITMVVLPTGIIYLVVIPYSVIGACSIQTIPIYLELSSECGFPVSEQLSTGFLQGCSQMMGFLFGSIASLILDGESEWSVFVVQIGSIAILAICLILLKVVRINLNRMKIDAVYDKDVIIMSEEEIVQKQNKIKENNVKFFSFIQNKSLYSVATNC